MRAAARAGERAGQVGYRLGWPGRLAGVVSSPFIKQFSFYYFMFISYKPF
jgi:hypothetical protein